jgi:hypothetical protein
MKTLKVYLPLFLIHCNWILFLSLDDHHDESPSPLLFTPFWEDIKIKNSETQERLFLTFSFASATVGIFGESNNKDVWILFLVLG